MERDLDEYPLIYDDILKEPFVKVVLIFTKVPVPGQVKRDLTEDTCLTQYETSEIARAMLKDTILLASKTDAVRIDIAYTPLEDKAILEDLVETVRNEQGIEKPIVIYPQTGSDLEGYLSSAVLSSIKKGAELIVGLRDDLPYLHPQIINKCFNILSENLEKTRVILGPSRMGEVYLMGFTKNFDPDWFMKYKLFTGGIEIPQIIKFCRKMNLDLFTLSLLQDIDNEHDLISLIMYIEAINASLNTMRFFYPKYTANILERLKISVIEDKMTKERKIGKSKIEFKKKAKLQIV